MSGRVEGLVAHKGGGFTLLRLFSRRWILATLLVIAGATVLARLGIWQLDRLAQRRQFNARVQAQVSRPQLELTGAALNADLAGMEYRPVSVRGQYDFSHQVALRNQAWEDQGGVQLLTPMKIDGTEAYVLVERGWVPGLESTPQEWRQYDEPGTIEVRGIIRQSQSKPDLGRRVDPVPAPGEGPLTLWYFANVERISAQLPYKLLPIYIQQGPDPAWSALPYRSLPELDLTEGPHQSYALQWFGFATLLVVGYPFFVRKRELTH